MSACDLENAKLRRKLIEVALPLDEINVAGAREKSIRHGHPSTLHLWWARRPLAAARAVIFSQMVDDPSAVPEEFPGVEEQQAERERLFGILRDLVVWENTANETVLERARAEIRRSWRRACADNADHPRAAELFNPERLPAFHDPFAGGGALPLEAQRLGLEAHASDLNPVAVLINKAMIEIPPKFAGLPPVNPEDRTGLVGAGSWPGATGLAADVRHYGQWIRDEAEKRIGHLYPKVEVTAEMARERPDLRPYVGGQLTVIAWLWARTVRSPNPAFADVEVPLVSSFVLSSRKGKEAYVEPVIEGRDYRFNVKMGMPPAAAKTGTKLARGAIFRCLVSGTVINDKHVKRQSMAGLMNERLMAMVAEGDRGRVYLAPTDVHTQIALQAKPTWKPDEPMNRDTTDLVSGRGYGFFTWADLFTSRQLVALSTLSDLVFEVQDVVMECAERVGMEADAPGLADGGTGARAYAEAVGVYLGMATSKLADLCNSLCRWEPVAQCPRNLFGRQAIPMIWDFAEGNPLGERSGSWQVVVDGIAKAFSKLVKIVRPEWLGHARQENAVTQITSRDCVVSTDPPYYDNIGYADLSDFFYIWLRRSLRSVVPDIFGTVSAPKAAELIASPYRYGSPKAAEHFFLDGMERAISQVAGQAHPGFPVTVYYAFKQSETQRDGTTTSTAWETFLEAVIRSGFAINGTWPLRTENSSRLLGLGTNALATSIVLVCKPRLSDSPLGTRQHFTADLRAELPEAMRFLQSSNIVPVDLAQAAIGPGMGVYTRYEQLRPIPRMTRSRSGACQGSMHRLAGLLFVNVCWLAILVTRLHTQQSVYPVHPGASTECRRVSNIQHST